MENEPLTEDWLGVFIQWSFFFYIVAILLLPGFLFMRVAKRHNRSGWVYFPLGLAVGFGSFRLSSLLLSIVRDSVQSEIIKKSLSWIVFLLALLFILISVRILKYIFSRNSI